MSAGGNLKFSSGLKNNDISKLNQISIPWLLNAHSSGTSDSSSMRATSNDQRLKRTRSSINVCKAKKNLLGLLTKLSNVSNNNELVP